MRKKNKIRSKIIKSDKSALPDLKSQYTIKLNFDKDSKSRFLTSDHLLQKFKLENLVTKDLPAALREFLGDMLIICYQYVAIFTHFKLKNPNLKSDVDYQTIKIDLALKKQLIQKVNSLIMICVIQDLHVNLLKISNLFSESLKEELQILNNKNYLYRIIGLSESYKLIELFSSEISQITQGLYDCTGISYPIIFKCSFYKHCFIAYLPLIDHIYKEDSHNPIIKTVNKLGIDLKKLSENSCNILQKNNLADMITHSIKMKTVVLCHINGDQHERRSRRRSNISTAEASLSPKSKNFEMDAEVDEFKNRIEAMSPAVMRLKPNVNFEYLNQLQMQIKLIKP